MSFSFIFSALFSRCAPLFLLNSFHLLLINQFFFHRLFQALIFLPSLSLNLHVPLLMFLFFTSHAYDPSLPPCSASRVHYLRAAVSGTPVLRTRWPRLLWETLWYGEDNRKCLDLLHHGLLRHSLPALPEFVGYTIITHSLSQPAWPEKVNWGWNVFIFW